MVNDKIKPVVTVLMSVYNAEEFLNESIDSILNQTFSNFEFIIINDACTDNSLNMLQSYIDKRIKIITNRKNIGLTKSLNKGLKLAQGSYIARMDSDDISMPTRLEKQVLFMENNPDIYVCGTWLQILEKKNIWRPPCNHLQIMRAMLENNSLYHPTAIMKNLKKEMFYYDETFRTAQDYELWTRIGLKHKLANIPEVLLLRRVHDKSIGKKKSIEQAFNAKKIRLNLLRHFYKIDFITFFIYKLRIHKIMNYKFKTKIKNLVKRLLCKIIKYQ